MASIRLRATKPRIGAFLVALSCALPAFAADPVQQHNSNALWFENWVGLNNASLIVAAPNGKVTEVFAASGTPVFELDRAETMDGVYRYELRAATEEQETIVNASNSGREGEERDTHAVPYYATGQFVVERGVIIVPREIEEDNG